MLSGSFLMLTLMVGAPAPKEQPPPVVALFEDDVATLERLLSLDGDGKGAAGKIAVEKNDVFAGQAIRVSGAQRYHHEIEGWKFRIAEEPKAGEYRYLRFAWKKEDKGPIMLQFCTLSTGRPWFRYYAGKTEPPWPSKVLVEAAPTEWRVVTRDLYADFGAFDLVGFALSPLSGGDGLFDHVLLGRSVADLDQATATTLLKDKPKKVEANLHRQLWLDLASADRIVADTATWTFVAGRTDTMPYLLKTITLPEKKAEPVKPAVFAPLLERLGHERSAVRDEATKELLKLGDGMLPLLRTARAEATGEMKARLQAVLDQRDAQAPPDEHRLRRCQTILRAVGTPEAKEMLLRIERALP